MSGQTMRAAVCREHGPPEVVAVESLARPEPGPGEVLVRVGAAAINFPDVLIVADGYQVSLPTPFVPGSEVAGEVVALGPGVDGAAPGDLVFGATMVGAFAEYVALPGSGSLTRPRTTRSARSRRCDPATGWSCSGPRAASASPPSTWRRSSAAG